MRTRMLCGAVAIAGLLGAALPATSQDAATNAALRAKGEAYHRAPDSEQIPAEVAETARLNAAIVAANNQAAAQEEADRTEFLEAQVRHQAQVDAAAEAHASAEMQHEAEVEMSAEARARHAQAMADWRATVAACEAGDDTRCEAGKAPAMPVPVP